MSATTSTLSKRFRGFLPVVIDIETAGFNYEKDAILEIAAVIVSMDDNGILKPSETHSVHVEPFEGANLDREALEFTGIDPYHPFRFAKPEKEALQSLFDPINAAVKQHKCSRAVMVAHNPLFDMSFLLAAMKRTKVANPFHKFTSFDTATLGGLAFGQTVLARACQAAKVEFNVKEAHSAIYDAEQTAKLFCHIANRWKHLLKCESKGEKS